MGRFWMIFAGLVLIAACCPEGRETKRFMLTEAEKEFIPYAPGQEIEFVHSGGFSFDLSVTEIRTGMMRTETEHCGEDYSSYELRTAVLQSNIPELYISLSISPRDFSPVLSIVINDDHYFQLNTTENPGIDSISLHGRYYFEVYEMKDNWADTTLIVPQRVLFNRQSGLLHITMTNGEEYTINE